MPLVLYILAAVMGALGFIFVVGSQGQLLRIFIGVVCFIAAGVLVYLARVRPQPSQTTVVQKIDLSGDINLESLRCQQCDAPLSKESVSVEAGAVMVNCEYCGANYQIEEKPKW
ncbi:MAG: non-structural protein NS4A [Anaerolineales bacterium]|nr:non-structural protein NS4A [Anaerolineales bacterium]